MTVVGVVVVSGVLGLVLLRAHALRVGTFVFAAVWGFLLGATPAGPPVGHLLDELGASLWQAVNTL